MLAAGGDDSAAARRALATLCETYWYPLYAYLRRGGQSPDDASDLTQAFLTSLIERRDFDDLRKDRGRFRAFLLAALKHFLSNERARQRAQKRGSGQPLVPLGPSSLDAAEGRYAREPADAMTPETIFDRRWALTVIDRVLSDVRAVWDADGRASEFDALRPALLGETSRGGYAALAAQLGKTEGAVKVAVHRLRRQFQQQLRRQIRETVASADEVEAEIQYLIRAVSL